VEATPDDLTTFTGTWFSDEAGATISVVLDGDKAFLRQRPALSLPMQPLYKDHFDVQGYVIWFTRDMNGKVDRLHAGAPRMRDMPFVRVQ
jgi:hypothetical protein